MADERRFQVFVSSTFLDLKDERAAVISALLQLEAMPAGMELFPAANDDAWTLIKRVIDLSDYYILVIGGKYGSTDPETEISYTEMEYEYAVEQKKPVMAFLHSDPDELKVKDAETDEQARAKLTAFREKVKQSKHIKTWSNADDLAGKVALSFASFKQTYPAVGWIRGDVQTSTESLSELNELRKRVAGMEKELDAARSGPPPEAAGLASGDDAADLEVTYTAEVRLDSQGRYEPSKKFTLTRRESMSWNDIFACAGPDLLDEADEDTIRSRISSWVTQQFGADARATSVEIIAEHEGPIQMVLGVNGALTDDAFGTLIIQLRALGLLTKSERARSVKDKSTYWTLTPYGDAHLTTLRAISRHAGSDGVVTSGEPAEVDSAD